MHIAVIRKRAVFYLFDFLFIITIIIINIFNTYHILYFCFMNKVFELILSRLIIQIYSQL